MVVDWRLLMLDKRLLWLMIVIDVSWCFLTLKNHGYWWLLALMLIHEWLFISKKASVGVNTSLLGHQCDSKAITTKKWFRDDLRPWTAPENETNRKMLHMKWIHPKYPKILTSLLLVNPFGYGWFIDVSLNLALFITRRSVLFNPLYTEHAQKVAVSQKAWLVV